VVKGGAPLKGVRIAGEILPRLIDEIPALVVAACCADGVTVIRDAGELRIKESDRLATIATELGKMGARIGVLADGLAIEGGAALTGAVVESHDDHRIAMALAIAGLNAQGETTVRGTGSVGISYPGFLADLRRLTGSAG
jgi:3-phosphoshikimate 1-carboxyvinyltransferase